jgi:excisionase family DNA binding protein
VELLTVAQAAERLGVKAQLVYQLCAAKKLRHARIGNGRGTIKIPAVAIDEYLSGVMIAPKKDELPPERRAKLKHLRL